MGAVRSSLPGFTQPCYRRTVFDLGGTWQRKYDCEGLDGRAQKREGWEQLVEDWQHFGADILGAANDELIRISGLVVVVVYLAAPEDPLEAIEGGKAAIGGC